MEQRENNIEIEAIDEALLADYEGVILPDIYELLEETAQEEALTEHYLCIGAKEESVAVAALVLELEEETGDLVILSLFVAQEYRRQYIATDLIHSALQIAAESFIFWEGEEEDLVQMKMSSLLPEDIHEVFYSVANHRMELSTAAKAAGKTEFDVTEQVLSQIPIPKIR